MSLRSVVTAVVSAALLVTGCTTSVDPAEINYLNSDQATQVVKRVTDEAGSDQITGVRLATFEASVDVVQEESGRVETWTLREGIENPARTGNRARTGADQPAALEDLDLATAAELLPTSNVMDQCSERGVRWETVIDFGNPVTHFVCLDNSQHVWLGPDLSEYSVIDLRTEQGIATGISDLRRVSGAGPILNLALLFDRDSQIAIELTGPCGNPVDCKSVEAARKPLVSNTSPIQVQEVNPRLNYAEPFDIAELDPARLQQVIKTTMEAREYNWWGSFAVTIYRLPGEKTRMEYRVRQNVFYTELDGTPITP